MTFAYVGELLIGASNLKGAAIDVINGFLYVCSNNSNGPITKIRLSDFTEVTTLSFTTGETPRTMVIDTTGGFLYSGSDSVTKNVNKIQLSTFTKVNSLALTSAATCSCIDLTNGYAYFAGASGNIDKINLSTFTKTTLNTGVTSNMNTAVIDVVGDSIYFGRSNGNVTKIQISTFTVVGNLGGGIGSLFGSVIDTVNGYAYFTHEGSPGQIIKVKLSDFTLNSTLNVTPDDLLDGGVIDIPNQFAYFYGSNSSTNKDSVVQIDLNTFTKVGDITISTTSGSVSYVPQIDLINGVAYFPLRFLAGAIEKISLGVAITTIDINCPVGWTFFTQDLVSSTLADVAALNSMAVNITHYNATGKVYETNRANFNFNETKTIFQKEGIGVYCVSPAIYTLSFAGTPSIALKTGWNLVANWGKSDRTLGTLKTSIGGKATSASYFNKITQTFQTDDATIVPAMEAFFVNMGGDVVWSG